MGLMLEKGAKPVGEIYQTPPKEDSDICWMIAHFYSGDEVKLIRFKKPLEAPEPDSPMDRIYDLEDSCLQQDRWIKSIMEFIKGVHGTDLGIAAVDADIAKWEAFIAMRDSLLVTDSPYMVTNFELLQKDRGWIGD